VYLWRIQQDVGEWQTQKEFWDHSIIKFQPTQKADQTCLIKPSHSLNLNMPVAFFSQLLGTGPAITAAIDD
jgi:hypothetical protein